MALCWRARGLSVQTEAAMQTTHVQSLSDVSHIVSGVRTLPGFLESQFHKEQNVEVKL